MTSTQPPDDAVAPGRRARKKAATRQALADAALELFFERGFDAVGVKDVADAADVSVATLFKHFPNKESLVFDDDLSEEEGLVAAVRDRPPGAHVVASLRDHVLRRRVADVQADPRFPAFVQLVRDTPALGAHAEQMWLRHEGALARALAEETGAPVGSCAALARFVLDTAASAGVRADGHVYVLGAFAILERGWGEGSAAARA
ncbi:MAG TPA: helix-turn-helix domain-containing protein [Cellulomonas sp.]